ncbi:ABC-F type ribosomal protection protein [Aminipila butyrica]|uniref:ABC-F type ribosomal protection protein n=1 Tax=Aminipila butyrica TaxID=433296 RepID=A0A858BXV4_9FIRM|nr:ABC-F type ribosomal protection protein [Aminipila butyrica]QIB69740.1 ABC-F type ribosomal protection protein [Aminipila butyrica]
MSLINISNLTFAYDGSYDNIIQQASFQLDTDWKLGFIGRNGKGKTTFLKLLLGQYDYSGKISANVEFDYFPYEVADEQLITMEVIDEVCGPYQQWELVRELSLLQVDDEVLWRSFGTLSHGERTKVLLAALFLKSGHFLLIDEPTNHLDREARELVCNYLNKKKGFILVSHDRFLLDNCVDHILSFNKSDIQVCKGNFSSWWENKDRRDNFELARHEKLQKDIKQLGASARRMADWSDQVEKTKVDTKNSGLKVDKGYVGHKAAKMMKHATAVANRREAAIEEKSRLLKNIDSSDSLKIHPLTFHTSKLLELENVSIFYEGRTACQQVRFSLQQGERISLKGKNGSGKSSLFKLICGEPLCFKGNFRRESQLKVSYVPQDSSFLRGSLTDYARESQIDESLFKTILRKLDFSRVQFEKDMADYSGGQKKKVLMAKSLCEQAHLYIWDEPLNYVDVISRMQIEELLLSYAPTLLFVEHDSVFCEKIATRQIEL